MDLISKYRSIAKRLTDSVPNILVDNVDDLSKSIELVDNLVIGFSGYSNTLISKYLEVKAELLIFLKHELSIMRNNIDSVDRVAAEQFNGEFPEYIEILKKNPRVAAYIIRNEKNQTMRYAMQVNLQRFMTGRKMLFVGESSLENKTITYPDHIDLKINKLQPSEDVPKEYDTVLSIKSRIPNYVYSYKNLIPSQDTPGVNEKSINDSKSIMYKEGNADYISPIDIISCECVNWIDPTNCSYESMLRPLYVDINGKLYKGRCIDNVQLLIPDMKSHISKKIISSVRSYSQKPSNLSFEEIPISKIKNRVRDMLKGWSKNPDKVKNTDTVCRILYDAIVSTIPTLSEEIDTMCRVATHKLVFKERKTIMDSYNIMSEETIRPILIDIIENNSKSFAKLNENISLFCKIISSN